MSAWLFACLVVLNLSACTDPEPRPVMVNPAPLHHEQPASFGGVQQEPVPRAEPLQSQDQTIEKRLERLQGQVEWAGPPISTGQVAPR